MAGSRFHDAPLRQVMASFCLAFVTLMNELTCAFWSLFSLLLMGVIRWFVNRLVLVLSLIFHSTWKPSLRRHTL